MPMRIDYANAPVLVSIQDMPVTDADVGITEFLGSHNPFRAVVKQTIDDFVVNEILLSGKIARITQLARSPAPRQARQTTAQIIEPVDLDNVQFDNLDQLFPPSTPASTVIRDALNAKQTPFTLPPCSDKQVRTKIHDWVRENLPAYVTDTINADGQSAVRLRRKDLCRPWKRRRVGLPNVSSQPDAANDDTYDPREGKDKSIRSLHVGPKTYVQFTLWKRNRDTTEALSILGKLLNVPANAFTYAGTKDKRAVTTQLVQVRGISEGRFAHANRILQQRERGFPSMVIGNVEPAPRGIHRPLGLGDLRGNRFTIALRDLELDPDGGIQNVMAGVESLRELGFVNYFGLQRFGSGVSPTHETGFAALRGDFEDVCRRILLPLRVQDEREGLRPERQRFVTAMERFANKEITAKQFEEDLPRWMFIERTIVGSFVDDERSGIPEYDFKKAFESLPRNLKRMYGHAVQSFLWNIMASERIRRSRPNVPERMFAVEGDIIRKIEKRIRDFSYETEVKSVTQEEENDKSVPVSRVLIPVIGSEVCLPNAEYACTARKILEEQKIDLTSKTAAKFGMKGTYRPLITKPVDVEAKVMPYVDRNVSLIRSGIEQSYEQNDAKSKDERNRSLAKLGIAVDSNGVNSEKDCEETGTDDKERRVFHCASGKDRSRHLTMEGKRTDHPVTKGQVANETENLIAAQMEQSRTEEGRHALVLSFTLGCAEYATMLVRELTRQGSSTAHQKALQDGVPIASSTPQQKEGT